jgi:DUF4097 and DUF4098 domain-containing protein YvlB
VTFVRFAATAIIVLALPIPSMGQTPARLDTTVHLDLRGTVDLSIVSGKITVRGWDSPDVKIVASTESGTLRFDATQSRLTLRVDPEGDRARPRGNASFDVSVPRGIRLRLQGVSGNITAGGSQGEISATTIGGAIDVAGGRRQVALESVSGAVRASQTSGELRVQSVSGNVRADNVSGRLEATTVSGTIRLSGMRANDIRAQTASGDIVYAGRVATGGTYDFESHSGTIRLTVPSNAGAQFRLEAFSGSIQNDFSADAAVTGSNRKTGRVEFTVGDGRARVTASHSEGLSLTHSERHRRHPSQRFGLSRSQGFNSGRSKRLDLIRRHADDRGVDLTGDSKMSCATLADVSGRPIPTDT